MTQYYSKIQFIYHSFQVAAQLQATCEVHASRLLYADLQFLGVSSDGSCEHSSRQGGWPPPFRAPSPAACSTAWRTCSLTSRGGRLPRPPRSSLPVFFKCHERCHLSQCAVFRRSSFSRVLLSLRSWMISLRCRFSLSVIN